MTACIRSLATSLDADAVIVMTGCGVGAASLGVCAPAPHATINDSIAARTSPGFSDVASLLLPHRPRALGQRQDRIAVRPREAAVGGSAPRQPDVSQMLARAKAEREPARERRAKTRARYCAWCPAHSDAATAERSRIPASDANRQDRRTRRRRCRFPRAVRAARSPRDSRPRRGCRSPIASDRENRRVRAGARAGRPCERPREPIPVACSAPAANPRPSRQLISTQNGRWRSRQNVEASESISSSVCQSFGCVLR